MRENLPFDDFVKKQLDTYSAEVPSHVWDNILAAKRKSKPKGFWINMLSGSNLLILIFALLTGGAAFYILTSSKKENSSTKNIADNRNIPAAQNEKASPQNVNGEANHATLTAEPNLSKIDTQSSPSNKAFDNNPDFSSNTNHNTLSSNKNKIKNIYLQNDNNEEINEGGIATNNIEVTNKLFSSPFTINKTRELISNKKLNLRNINLPDCPTIEKNAAGNKQYWEVYAGPDYAFQSFKTYGDTASANYLEKRKGSTKFASAFSAGVRYTKVFNNGTSVRAGVNYSQINEKFLYFNPNEIKYVTVITTRVVIRAPGDTIYINDTLQYQQTGARVKTTINRYHNIDIPLVIGYELGNGKIHANINAGVIINVYSWYKGDVLDTLYQPVSITTGKGNSAYQFKTNIGVGFLGSISVYYRMTDRLHLVLEPYFRYNLSPISKENLNLQQKYHVAGLRAGVRFDLK